MVDEKKAEDIFYKYAKRSEIFNLDSEDFLTALRENTESVPAETLDTTKIILMVSVNKTSKIDGKIFNKNCHYIGYDRDKLRKYLLTFYKIKNLIRDVGDEFPYFTDGGFRYTAENEYWKYEFICHPYNIID